MSRVVYLRMIMAMMSVPPLEAPTWKRMAEPMAGRATAKMSSRNGWFVMGPLMGRTRSSTQMRPDWRRVTYVVYTPKLFPRTMYPNKRRTMLMIRPKVPGVEGK